VEPERLAVAQPVIEGQGCGGEGAVGGGIRPGTRHFHAGEEERHIAQLGDERVIGDAVIVVEVETVLKVVGVGRQHGQKKGGHTRLDGLARLDW